MRGSRYKLNKEEKNQHCTEDGWVFDGSRWIRYNAGWCRGNAVMESKEKKNDEYSAHASAKANAKGKVGGNNAPLRLPLGTVRPPPTYHRGIATS